MEENVETPDWREDNDLTTDQQYNLTYLSELMIEQPIIWVMIQGVTTSQTMAARLCWPHDWVMIGLRQYKEDGFVVDREGLRSIEWHFSDQMADTEIVDMVAWVHTQKGKGGLFSRNENG
jgi:hypothetical protein